MTILLCAEAATALWATACYLFSRHEQAVPSFGLVDESGMDLLLFCLLISLCQNSLMTELLGMAAGDLTNHCKCMMRG